MSCTKCDDLCQEVRIRTPSELERVVRIAKAALDAGVIVDVSRGPLATPMSDLVQPGWPDMVSADFSCAACGALFQLSCETYHGSGGNWAYAKPPKDDAL